MTVSDAAGTRLVADPAEARRALSFLLQPGQVTELRALDVSTAAYRRPHTASGYFDDPDALVGALAAFERGAKCVYVALNPVEPALLARAANRVRDVADREPLTGVRSIHDALAAEGWPEPLMADSGNGGHLLYPVDLPTDDGGLVRRVLAALAFRFDDDTVAIDQSVCNPARIWKLYGTVARKGDSTPDRPHRLARILEAPVELAPLSLDLLEALASAVPDAGVRSEAPSAGGTTFDLVAWIAKHNLDVVGPAPWQGGERWIFSVCPWYPDHRNRSAYLLRLSSHYGGSRLPP